MWGDYKSDKDASRLVRSDRTLYGLQAVHESQAQTSFGEPRLRLSGYAAEPDRLVKRDTLRGTGGSSYFLSQQDIISGTETLMVLCCTNPVRDSSCESSVIAGVYEQTEHTDLQDAELARV